MVVRVGEQCQGGRLGKELSMVRDACVMRLIIMIYCITINRMIVT